MYGPAVLIVGIVMMVPSDQARNPAYPDRTDAGPAVTLALDHVPIAVRDLPTARRRWSEALGFTIKAGRVHDNSIENVHIKFGDGSALEVITASKPADALAASYLAFLDHGDGGAFLALAPADFGAVEEAVSNGGFEHHVVVGPYYRWLTFPPTEPLGFLFFSELTNAPVDAPDLLRHGNGAIRLGAVWVAGGRSASALRLFETMGLKTDGATVDLPGGVIADRLKLAAGEVYLARSTEKATPPIAGITIVVRSIEQASKALRVDSAALMYGSDWRGAFVRVPPDLANGIWLEFLEERNPGRRGPGRTTGTMEDDV